MTSCTRSLRPRLGAGNSEAKAGVPQSSRKNADCQFLDEVVSGGYRLGSFHDEGEARCETFVARTVTDTTKDASRTFPRPTQSVREETTKIDKQHLSE